MRHLRAAAGVVVQTALIVLGLWTFGACLGLVAVGFCMVAGCRG